MSARYFVGLDLGQASDYSALAVLEVEGFRLDAILRVRHLLRWKLGTSYPQICEETHALLQREPLQAAPLIVDATGVGRPVVDLFRPRLGWGRLNAALITAGNAETKSVIERVPYWSVPKRILVTSVQVPLQTRKLKIAPDLPDASVLTRELQNFQVKINDSGHDTYGAWRAGTHDDLVFSVSLACWAANHRDFISIPTPLILAKVKGGPLSYKKLFERVLSAPTAESRFRKPKRSIEKGWAH
jgi:hypothetical protein